MYETLFLLSLLFSFIYLLMWRKHFNVNITVIFLITPIANLGHVFLDHATDVMSVSMALKFIYISGCFLPFFVTMCVLDICDINVNTAVRVIGFAVSSFLYASVLTIGYKPYYYKALYVHGSGAEKTIIKEYGPLHTVFYVVVSIYLLIGIFIIAHTYIKKKQISNTILRLMFLPALCSMLGYFGNALTSRTVEVTPFTYVFAQIVYIFIVRRMSLYKVSDMVIESMVQSGDTGFISVDFKNHFLGANETAKNILPELRNLAVDQDISGVEELSKNLNHWIIHFKEDNTEKNLFIKRNPENEDENEMFIVNTNYLYDGSRKCGYQIFLVDDTKNQKYIALLDKYNSELEEEVEKKTRHIVEMHDNLILSMATMVESRDNSTGGHIRRTSMGVRILMDEIKKDPSFNLTESFCKNIIKAAPMHDLGKVAVDDAILRKPGRFTPEEFEIMKSHAAEGAKIVHEILKDTDNEEFRIIAENVAHFHHERMDGSGYPEGLKGDEIPLEARIMAIADVYDALVSKRVYKEKMSFEEADKIMMESMGKHFDKRLEPFYVKARPVLESYYASLE